jgi:hypothetical protein
MGNDEITTWRMSFAFMPHKCIKSGKIIWLKFGYLGITDTSDFGSGHDYKFEWVTKEEFVLMVLKGLV